MAIRIPKGKFLELKSKQDDYPEQLKKLRKPGSKGPHLPPPEERVARSPYSRYRGPAYVKLHDGRGVYNVFPYDRLGPEAKAAASTSPLRDEASSWRFLANKDRAGWTAAASFPEAGGFPGPKKLFALDKAVTMEQEGQLRILYFKHHYSPFNWTPHHLVPVEAMGPKGPFSEQTRTFIQESFYEIDNGHNLMMLPFGTEAAPQCALYCLLPHVDNHDKYRAWTRQELAHVDAKLADLQNEIQEKDKKKKHDQIMEHLISELYQAEKKFWTQLQKLGVRNVEELLKTGRSLTGQRLVREEVEGKVRWGVLA